MDYFLIVWLLKSSLSALPFILFRPRINPPIRPAFIRLAFIWKEEKWNIKVVWTINISRRYEPDFCLNPVIKSIEPKIRKIIANFNKNTAIIVCIFLFEITSTVYSKFIIFPGIA